MVCVSYFSKIQELVKCTLGIIGVSRSIGQQSEGVSRVGKSREALSLRRVRLMDVILSIRQLNWSKFVGIMSIIT